MKYHSNDPSTLLEWGGGGWTGRGWYGRCGTGLDGDVRPHSGRAVAVGRSRSSRLPGLGPSGVWGLQPWSRLKAFVRSLARNWLFLSCFYLHLASSVALLCTELLLLPEWGWVVLRNLCFAEWWLFWIEANGSYVNDRKFSSKLYININSFHIL